MSISHCEIIPIRCATCGKPFKVEAWFIINGFDRPDLWQRCLKGQLDVATCPSGHGIELAGPLLLLDTSQSFAVFSPGEAARSQAEAMEPLATMRQQVMNELATRGESTDYLRVISTVSRKALPEVMRHPELLKREFTNNGKLINVNKLMARIDAAFGDDGMPDRIALIEDALLDVTVELDSGTWAWLQERLGTSLIRNPHGNHGDNVERAIKALDETLSVFTKNALPERWADTQLNLSYAYIDRTSGDRRQNLITAMKAATLAMDVYKSDTAPQQWDKANNLYLAALQRLKSMDRISNPSLPQVTGTQETSLNFAEGIKSKKGSGEDDKFHTYASKKNKKKSLHDLLKEVENLPEPTKPDDYSRAIELYEALLSLYVDQIDSDTLATFQFRLSLYVDASNTGDQDRNKDRVIFLLGKALNTSRNLALKISIGSNLALAWETRLAGSKIDNLIQAACILEEVIPHAKDLNPSTAAELSWDLGMVYIKLDELGSSQDPNQIIANLNYSLETYTSKIFPERWAFGKLYIAITYSLFLEYAELPTIERSAWCTKGLDAIMGAMHYMDQGLLPHLRTRALVTAGNLFYGRMGGDEDFERALAAYKHALKTCDRSQEPDLWLTAKRGIRTAYKARKGKRSTNFEHAIQITREIIDVLTPDQSRDWSSEHIQLGTLLLDICDMQTGSQANTILPVIDECIKAFEVASTVIKPEDTQKLKLFNTEIGIALFRRSFISESIADLNRSIEHLKAAFAIPALDHKSVLARVNSSNVYFMLAQAYQARGLSTGSTADKLEAVSILEAGVKFLEQSQTSQITGRLATMYSALGAAKKDASQNNEDLLIAATYFDKAIQNYPPWWHIETRIAATESGKLLFKLQMWSEAYEALRLASNSAENEFSISASDSERTENTAQTTLLFQMLVECCIRMDQPRYREALLHSEQGRSRLLRAQLGMGDIPAPIGVPSEVIASECDLITRLRTKVAAQLDLNTQTTDEAWHEEVQQLRSTLGEIWQTLETTYHALDYVALRRGEKVSWDQIADWLNKEGKETALLSFYGLPKTTLAFILCAESKAPIVVELPLDAELIQNYQQRLVAQVHDYDPISPLQETWKELSKVILPEVLPHIQGVKNLYVIPYGLLHSIPMHALFYQGKALIDYLSVAYAPSIAAARRWNLAAMSQKDTRVESAAVIGDPTGDLPSARAEAIKIADVLRISPILGADANKARVAQALEEATTYAHIAAHAVFEANDPFASGILTANNEVLTAREIAQQLKTAKLVVLSACQSGLQSLRPSDELVGLANALTYAGANSVIMSLWPVDDDSTSQLMQDFYLELTKQLVSEGDVAGALKKAMIKMRDQGLHTHEWAPFVLYGSPKILTSSR